MSVSLDYVRKFVNQHPKLSKRKADQFDRNRATGSQRKRIVQYFAEVLPRAFSFINSESVVPLTTGERKIKEGEEGRIANYDESSMSLYRNGDGNVVVSRKGKRKVHALTPACRESMTLGATVLGNGKVLDGCLVHKACHARI